MSFHKTFLFLILVVVVGLWGACVEIPEGPGTNTNPDFRSLARFMHADPGGPSGALMIDGASAGNLSFPGTIAYRDVASGSRSLIFAAAAAQTINFISEQQSTVLVYAAAGGGVGYLYLPEGHMAHPNGDTSAPLVRFVHVGNGSAADVQFYAGAVDPDNEITVAGFEDVGSYVSSLAPGAQAIVAVSQGSYTSTLSAGSGAYSMVAGDELSYSVALTTTNSDGFLDSAHFHVGQSGTSIHSINVFGQQITFEDNTLPLSSDQEVPPVAVPTSASGTGTFILGRDTSGNVELRYTISVTRDTTDTLFIAAHFHNAPTGSAGGVVRNIVVGSTFGDTTISGVWSSVDAVQPLTPALLSQLMAGNIYVNFHSTLNTAGAIRTQLIMDVTTANEYTGSFQPVQTEITELNSGNLYVNFWNAGVENKAPLQVQNQYGVVTLNTSAYAKGSRYTVVATGAGSTFQVVELADRTTGATKPVLSGGDVKVEESTAVPNIEKKYE